MTNKKFQEWLSQFPEDAQICVQKEIWNIPIEERRISFVHPGRWEYKYYIEGKKEENITDVKMIAL